MKSLLVRAGEGRALPIFLLFAACVLQTGLMGWLGTCRVLSFHSGRDHGLFVEALESALSGNPLFVPSLGRSYLHYHFAPVLLLLAPVYAVFRSAVTLVWIQALCKAAAALFLYGFSRKKGVGPWFSAALGAAFLFRPFSDVPLFTQDGLQPALIAGALYFLATGRTAAYFSFIALLLATKDDAFLGAAAIGLYAALSEKRWKSGIATVAMAAAWGGLVLGVIMPSINKVGSAFFATHYGYLGRTISEAAGKIALHPFDSIRAIAANCSPAGLLRAVVPLLFLPVFGWRAALLLLPVLEFCLSSQHNANHLVSYYALRASTFTFAAAAAGAATFLRLLPRAAPVATGAILAGAVILCRAQPESEYGPEVSWDAYLPDDCSRSTAALLDQVPAGASVCAQTAFNPNLAPRGRRLVNFPSLNGCEYAFFDLDRQCWPMKEKDFQRLAAGLLKGNAFGVAGMAGNAVLLRRGSTPERNAAAYEALFAGRKVEAEKMRSSARGGVTSDSGASCGKALAHMGGPAANFAYTRLFSMPAGRYKVEVRAAGGRLRLSTPCGNATDLDFPENEYGTAEAGIEVPESGECRIGFDAVSGEPRLDSVTVRSCEKLRANGFCHRDTETRR